MSRKVGVSALRVVIKDMRTRWGSCGPDRRMNLNWRLVLAPEPIIDYVLAHELTHIEVPNHSRAFWRKVARACEHASASRKWLRVHGDDLEL
jgi:predicted metal-dependent hydrolase